MGSTPKIYFRYLLFISYFLASLFSFSLPPPAHVPTLCIMTVCCRMPDDNPWFRYICVSSDQIILFADPPFGAQETLRAWQKKNHPWLELSDVHKETTENVRVTVIPFYMGCRESQATSVFWVCVYIWTMWL